MKKNYSNKAEVCYKDICANFYNENASVITAITTIAIAAVAVSIIAKALK